MLTPDISETLNKCHDAEMCCSWYEKFSLFERMDKSLLSKIESTDSSEYILVGYLKRIL